MKKLKILLPVLAVIFVVLVFAFSLLSGTEKVSNASGFAMGSPVNVTIYGIKDGEDYCNLAVERIKYIDENFLSHTLETSATYKLNKGETAENVWFSNYLNDCRELKENSDSFTLFSGEFKDLWQIESGGYVPNDEEIAKVLERHKNAELIIDGKMVSISGGKLDLGAFGKGTACDEALETFHEIGISDALVTVGGTVGMIGSPDGKNEFNIGIRNPFGNQNEYFATLALSDCFVSTSGDYEKYFEKDGIRYSHIFDAQTGKPVQNDISSVTVVANSGMLSDFLSTVIYIEGVEKGFEIANEFDAEIVIVKKDKTVLVSKELNGKLTVNDKSFSVSVIE